MTPVSSLEAQIATHLLRSEHDIILVGVGTILADNPQLNVRLCDGPSPDVVILDSNLRTSPTARVFDVTGTRVRIACVEGADSHQRNALEAAGGEVEAHAQDRHGRVDIRRVMDTLGSDGTRSVMVEGGARVLRAFLERRLVDELQITVSPAVFGEGLPAVRMDPPFPSFDVLSYRQCGCDLLVRLRPNWG